MAYTHYDSFENPQAYDTGVVDGLTGLPGMTRFYALARATCADMQARGEQPVALALNLVGMKAFNARYGLDEGDRLLRVFADVLCKHFGVDSCSRFAGDHFYALTQEEGITQRIAYVFDGFGSADLPATLPVRVGAYACDVDDDICEVGFERAQIACDLDTTTWSSSVHWFTEDMRSEARLRLHVCGCIENAIQEGWIRPLYQPIVRAATGAICGEEALARWDDPEFGELMPHQFVPVLEEAGLSHKLDLHVLDCVLADMQEREAAGVSLVPVSVNISPFDFVSIDLVQELVQRVDAAGIPHDLIRLELAESMSTYDLDIVAPPIADLRRAGFQVWLDNFANNYVSLNALTTVEIDGIKLGMDFLHGTMEGKARGIVEGVIRTATSIGVSTLAEGVETIAQADLLERAGCDLLQGHLFFRPLRLDVLIAHAKSDDAIRREPREERAYWDAISSVDMDDLTSADNMRVASGMALSEFPAGIIEHRDGAWHVLRANESYRTFLYASGLITPVDSHLQPRTMKGVLDPAYFDAATASRTSGTWQRIDGQLDYGSSFQYLVHHLASADEANAYLIVGIPTMLGRALGTYGDVPVSYAVFRVTLNDAGNEVLDTEYVYASDEYCSWLNIGLDDIVGRSFLSSVPDASSIWFPYLYRAAMMGEQVHDMVYSREIGHWVSFTVAPSPVDRHCVFAFTIADDEQRVQSHIRMERATSDLIVLIADALNDEPRFNVAVQNLLTTMCPILHADRLYIMELQDTRFNITAEYDADGITPRDGLLRELSEDELNEWSKHLKDDSVIFIDDLHKLSKLSDARFAALNEQGVHNNCVVPLFGEEHLIGYLGIDNYVLDTDFDPMRLLRTIGSFLAARLYNHRLMCQLEDASMLDGLTGVLNRRGIDMTVAARLAQDDVAQYTIILMDIDDFKTINDAYGHDVGDEALRTITHAITQVFPPRAIIGRNGGDEFMVMLLGDDSERVVEYLDTLLSYDLTCEVEGTRYRTTISAGYVTYPSQATSLRDAYRKADAALYAVKLNGKSSYDRYHEHMITQYRSQLGFTPRDIASNVPGAIVVHKPGDDQILFANEELIALLDCDDLQDFMEFTGGTFGGIIHPEDRVQVREELEGQITLDCIGAKDRVGYRVLTKKGNVHYVTNYGRLVEVEGLGKLFYELIVW